MDLDIKTRILRELEGSLASGGSHYLTPEKITVARDKWDLFTGMCLLIGWFDVVIFLFESVSFNRLHDAVSFVSLNNS